MIRGVEILKRKEKGKKKALLWQHLYQASQQFRANKVIKTPSWISHGLHCIPFSHLGLSRTGAANQLSQREKVAAISRIALSFVNGNADHNSSVADKI